jgi:hypothetical protein
MEIGSQRLFGSVPCGPRKGTCGGGKRAGPIAGGCLGGRKKTPCGDFGPWRKSAPMERPVAMTFAGLLPLEVHRAQHVSDDLMPSSCHIAERTEMPRALHRSDICPNKVEGTGVPDIQTQYAFPPLTSMRT